ncbi:MAG TPA: AIPR family protein [Terriglobales bacterium]|nr:AIPR family protein [Terriglobales bacterium]
MAKGANASDAIILNNILTQQRQELAPTLKESEFFELFCAREILRSYTIGPSEIQAGLVGKGNDGGIDGMYLFVDGAPVASPEHASALRPKRNVEMDLVFIQATTEPGFHINRITRIRETACEIFDLNRSTDGLSENPNPQLRNAIDTFRIAQGRLASSFPTFNVSFHYASKGDTAAVTPASTLSKKARELEKAVPAQLASISKCTFQFIGARGLVRLTSTPPQLDFTLRCKETFSSEHGGYVSLVQLKDYFSFITDQRGHRLDYLFDSNVRDYQPESGVNEDIERTLESKDAAPDFWWLNNGVTIVASKVGGDLKLLNIREPQIVNGLQTSYEIFKYFGNNHDAAIADERRVLVRTIGSPSPEVMDQIIRATNRQTSIKPASLWATDSIHRDLEQLFPSAGLYYDRRKSYWQNRNTPLDEIISITELAQAVISIVLREPDMARARPAKFFSDHAQYKRVFNRETPIDVFIACASIRKRAGSFLKSAVESRGQRNDLLYYVMMLAPRIQAGAMTPRTATLAAMRGDDIAQKTLQSALKVAKASYDECGGTDVAAKSVEMRAAAKKHLREFLAASHKNPKPSGPKQ